jgi:hypothetical protein
MILESIIGKDTIVIVDFYNCYCTLIKFCKFRTFSLDTFIICMTRIIEAIGTRRAVIVSKNIFEVEIDVILDVTKKYSNIKYIVVEDLNPVKSFNRERDDYTCLLLQALYKEKTVITSNDCFYNFEQILQNIKPFAITIIEKGTVFKTDINTKELSEHNKLILKNKKNLNRCGFRYLSSNKFEFFKK